MDKPIIEAKARAKELTRAVIGLLGARAPSPLTLGSSVSEIMTREVNSCRSTERLDAVAQILWDCDCGMVPLLSGEGTVVGVLTDRDLCMAAFTRGCSLSQIEAAQVMSSSLFFCLESDSLDRVVSLLRTHQVRRLPVVTADQKLCGVVSLADVAAHVAGLEPPAVHAQEILTSLLATLSRKRSLSKPLATSRVP